MLDSDCFFFVLKQSQECNGMFPRSECVVERKETIGEALSQRNGKPFVVADVFECSEVFAPKMFLTTE